MKIKTLRLWDYWIGRPLCFIFTVAYKLKKLFVSKGPIEEPKKILFIKLFGMGSIVLAMPSINAVKKKYQDSKVFFLTFKGNESVLTLTGIIPEQNIVTVRTDKLINLIIDASRSLIFLMRERIDVVIDLEFFSRFTAIMSFLIRSKYRIGFYGFHTEGLKRGSFIDFQINYNHTLHTSKAFFTLLKPLGIHQNDYSSQLPKVPPSEEFRDKVISIIRQDNAAFNMESINKWVVINPNSSDLIELRRWPEGHFLRLIDMLLEKYKSLGIILIGGKGERTYVESFRKTFTGTENENRIVNLAGMTSIRDLVDIFHFSELFITNDSGPAHIASLTNIKSIVLFGPETPDLYSPLGANATNIYLGLDCQPCITVYNGKNSFCRDNVCLQRLDTVSVFEIAADVIT
jgi:ADP-heptose:LPS heptosyltransferase